MWFVFNILDKKGAENKILGTVKILIFNETF
ncbi:hypothetical protein FB2170_02775 [Maribacter sp. HTCC2170]|nr:hypothetical protein FB2170_02775 [Maribacter sp. HTCC2170]